MLKFYWDNYWSVIIDRGIVSMLILGNSHMLSVVLKRRKYPKMAQKSLEEFEALQEMSSLYCLLFPIKLPIKL